MDRPIVRKKEMQWLKEVFRCENGFAAHVVGVHALPAPGKGAAVEDNIDSVVCGIAENVFVEAHCFLLVTAEEIDLDALHAVVFQPLHLFFTHDGAACTDSRNNYSVERC